MSTRTRIKRTYARSCIRGGHRGVFAVTVPAVRGLVCCTVVDICIRMETDVGTHCRVIMRGAWNSLVASEADEKLNNSICIIIYQM